MRKGGGFGVDQQMDWDITWQRSSGKSSKAAGRGREGIGNVGAGGSKRTSCAAPMGGLSGRVCGWGYVIAD